MSDYAELGAPVSIDPNTHKMGFGHVSYGADDALGVRFYWRPVEMGAQSKASGRPIYEKRVYVEITIPSDGPTKSVRDYEATDEDKKRFPRHWHAFQQGDERPQIGTPLEEWPLLDVAQVQNLKQLSIYSVEQLAALSDIQIAPLHPHGFNLRAQAQSWLEVAKDSGAAARWASEKAEMAAQLAEMRDQIRALASAKPAKSKRKYQRREKPQPSAEPAAA